MPNQMTINGTFATIYGNQAVNITLTVTSPIGAVTLIALAMGLNTITIPAGTTLVMIQLPSANSQTVTLKGVTGDTGILLNKTGTHFFMPDSADTSFVLTAGAAIPLNTTISFF